jgi:hypothetical protein
MKANTRFCAYLQLNSLNIYLSVEMCGAKYVQNVEHTLFMPDTHLTQLPHLSR